MILFSPQSDLALRVFANSVLTENTVSINRRWKLDVMGTSNPNCEVRQLKTKV